MIKVQKASFALLCIGIIYFTTHAKSSSDLPAIRTSPTCDKILCNSANSTTVLPNEESSLCENYAISQQILQMDGDSPEKIHPVGHLAGPKSPLDTTKAAETAEYIYDPETGQLDIKSSVPMNFVILENQYGANVYYYPSRSAVTEDTGLYLYDARATRATALPIQRLRVCYNLLAGSGMPQGLPEKCREGCDLPGFENELDVACKPGSEGTVVMAYQSASNRTFTEGEEPAAKYGRAVCDPEGKTELALCDFAGTDSDVSDCFSKGDFKLKGVQTIQIYDDGVVLCEWPTIAINIGGTNMCIKIF